MEVYLDAESNARIKWALRGRNSKEIENFLPYLNTYILSEGSLNRDAFSDVLRSQSSKAIESINDLAQRLNEYVLKEGRIHRQAFHAVLKSRNKKAIAIIAPYLNTYIFPKGFLNRGAFSDVLKSQSGKAIESIIDLKQCLTAYVLKEGCIDHEAFDAVLRSRNKKAVEIIASHLDRLDQYYIHNKDGSLNAKAIGNILCSRCKKPIEKILPFLDDYVMPSPGNIVPERIRNVLKSKNSEAINKIYIEGYLTAYVKSSDKPGECLNELKVGKRMKQRIQENLNRAQSEPIPSTFGPVENHLESLDFLGDPEAVNEINKILDTQTPSSSRTHRKYSLPQLTSDEVVQITSDGVEQTGGRNRFSNSIFSLIRTDAGFSNSFQTPELPIASINENPFGSVSIFSFYQPNVSDQSENKEEFITLRG